MEILKKMEEFEIKTTDLILEKLKKELGSISVERESNSFTVSLGRTKDKLIGIFKMFYSADNKCWVFDTHFEIDGYHINNLNSFNHIKDETDLKLFSDNYVYVFKKIYDVHNIFIKTGVPYFNRTVLGQYNPFYKQCQNNFYLLIDCIEGMDNLVEEYKKIIDLKDSVVFFNNNNIKKLEELSDTAMYTVEFLYDFLKKELLKLDLSDKDYFIDCNDNLDPYFEIESKDERFGSFSMSLKLFFDCDYDLGYFTKKGIYYKVEVCDYVSFLIPFNKVPISAISNFFIKVIDLFYGLKVLINKQRYMSLHTYSQYVGQGDYEFPKVYVGGNSYKDITYFHLYDDDYPLLSNPSYYNKITHVVLDDDSFQNDIDILFNDIKNRLDLQ